ncbi:MAG: hypothetical protein IT249_08920 [Chitinophagaceae bacterium]|nr:hypothetical protein [Chitinophagaceae bacterium]
MQFISPIDGDILHKHDGITNGSFLTIKAKIAAPAGSSITINNIPAKKSNGIFTADITLEQYKNSIEVTDKKTGTRKSITVYRCKNLAGKYRLSIDDATWFLKDIHVNTNTYTSIFENPFLKFLKQVHDTYATKVHINIFYETDGFNLSQLTDKFKSEWIANAGWLQLSFHAKAEFPDNPYKYANYAQVKKECTAVIEQIRRFAGDELVSHITTLHWGEVPVEVSRALRDCGYTGQLCDFNVDDNLPPCSYYLNVAQRRHMQKRFVWRDNKEDITFIKSSIIIDTKKLPEIIPYLNQYEKEMRKPPYVDLLVHEQYFYEGYHNYQPDYHAKVLTAVKWAKDNGYSPAFLGECIYE